MDAGSESDPQFKKSRSNQHASYETPPVVNYVVTCKVKMKVKGLDSYKNEREDTPHLNYSQAKHQMTSSQEVQ